MRKFNMWQYAVIAAILLPAYSIAGPVEPYQSKPVEVYQGGGALEPYKGKDVEQHKSKEIEIYKGKPVEEYKGKDIEPSMENNTSPNPANNTSGGQSSVMKGKMLVKIESSKNLASCTTVEGMQPGLTTVEAEGYAKNYAGKAIRLYVFNSNNQAVMQRKVGVMSNGKYTISIPAYNYPPDEYSFGVLPVDSDNYIAYGYFTVVQPTKPVPVTKPDTKTPVKKPISVVGTWYGVANTVGTIVIRPDGTYIYGGNVGGRYSVQGNEVIFTGNLKGWNGGRARITSTDNLEFYWTNSDGGINYFVFAK